MRLTNGQIDGLRQQAATVRRQLDDGTGDGFLRLTPEIIEWLLDEIATARVEGVRAGLEAVNRAIGGTRFDLDSPKRALDEINARLRALDPEVIARKP